MSQFLRPIQSELVGGKCPLKMGTGLKESGGDTPTLLLILLRALYHRLYKLSTRRCISLKKFAPRCRIVCPSYKSSSVAGLQRSGGLIILFSQSPRWVLKRIPNFSKSVMVSHSGTPFPTVASVALQVQPATRALQAPQALVQRVLLAKLVLLEKSVLQVQQVQRA